MKVTVLRQHRKTLSVTPSEDLLSVVVKAPYGYPDEKIMEFLTARSEKIERMVAAKRRTTAVKAVYSASTREGREKRKRALAYFTSRTLYWSERTGLYPKSVGLSSAETRYGSCSAAGRIVYSVILTDYEPELIDAVIVHELCHLKYMNHGRGFYALLEKIMPDYRARIRKIRQF